MQTIRLQVSSGAIKHLIRFLSRFKKEEIRIIKEDEEFVSVQNYLKEELASIEDGNAGFIDIDKLDAKPETTISQYED